MLHSVSDLMRYRARVEGDSQKVTELFFSRDDWGVAWLGLDIGGLMENRQVICSVRILGDPDSASRSVDVNASWREIEEAPRWTPEEMRLAPEDAANLVGPIGMSAGPLFLASTERTPERSDREAERVERRFDRATMWIGGGAWGDDGQLGKVDDLLYDPRSMRVTHLVIDNGNILPGRQLVVPVETVTGFSDENRAARLSLTDSQLEEAPQIETVDEIDRHWVDVLRTYYQLPV